MDVVWLFGFSLLWYVAMGLLSYLGFMGVAFVLDLLDCCFG